MIPVEPEFLAVLRLMPGGEEIFYGRPAHTPLERFWVNSEEESQFYYMYQDLEIFYER